MKMNYLIRLKNVIHPLEQMGCINIEFLHMHRTSDDAQYMIRMLWKTQQNYHTWLSQREEIETWKRNYILSSKSNATYMHDPLACHS